MRKLDRVTALLGVFLCAVAALVGIATDITSPVPAMAALLLAAVGINAILNALRGKRS